MRPLNGYSKRIVKNLLVPVSASFLAAGASLKDGPANIPVIALAGLAWASSSRNRVVDSDVGYRIKTDIKNLDRKVSELQSMTEEAIQLSSKGQDESQNLRSVSDAVRSGNRELRDLAGSVVRNLRLTREIAKKVGVDISQSFPKVKNALPMPVQASRTISSKKPTTGGTGVSEARSTQPDEFPENKPVYEAVSFPDVRVALIADEFTIESFRFEWNVLLLSKDKWREQLESFTPHFVLVESAWEGNGGDWRYQFVGSSAPRREIVDLVQFCKAEGIPTAFWNKEDPPHFEDFLETASMFDYIFTTEASLIEEYQKRTGNTRVELLPFAAQPALHNPVAIAGISRDKPVVFGGMYFREKFPERRGQMDRLLSAASRVGLDIFSRNSGEDIRYRYPDELAGNLRGSLRYPQMVTAYHAYKVVINVNSVVGSESMCARRIFEATACGAAVVTEPTPAIGRYFPGDLLSQVPDTDTAYHTIRSLVRSEEHRERRVLKAQREIWRHHTYTHRAETIMRAIGIDYQSLEPSVSYFVSTNRPHNLRTVFENVGRQTWGKSELLIATHGFEPNEEEVNQLADEFGIQNLQIIAISSEHPLGFCLNELVRASKGDILVRMDDDDYYGRWYAEDMVHAIGYTRADLVGKSATYIFFEEMDATVLSFPGKENRFTDFVRGATFAGPRQTFLDYPFPEAQRSEDSAVLSRLKKDGKKIYCTNRFNYAVKRDADKTNHTWQVGDLSLFGTGEMKFLGFDPKQIEA